MPPAAAPVIGVVFACLSAACGSAAQVRQARPAPSISAESYDRSCASVADCVVVHAGYVECCDVGCLNAVIRETAVPAYMRELASSQKIVCTKFDGTTVACQGDPGPLPSDRCQQGRVACQDGACVLYLPGADAAAGD